ncbi:MAG: hypothetical protein QOE92_2202 [Chloroflexota bacterium]|jgi:hypothetical protein|nr:hypothetical protein [Chloroflexota bacterium]
MTPVMAFLGLIVTLWKAFLNLFTTRTSREFERFTTVPLPGNISPIISAEQAPSVVNVAPLHGEAAVANPADCEETFTRLIAEGKIEAAWDLLSPDSQASWVNKRRFIEEMKSRHGNNVLDSKVREVRLLPTWTDEHTSKTYRQVAELLVDYRVRHQARELVVQRSVHVVNISGGWKSLCYRT